MTDSADMPDEVAAAREQVEQTREELAQTVAALADKADVKARARDKLVETKQRAQQRVQQAIGQAGHAAQSKAAALRDRSGSQPADGSSVVVSRRRFGPAEARAPVDRAISTFNSRPGAVALGGGLLAVVGLVMWRRGR
jgi:uncharacterized protein DUF3618